MKSFTGLLLFVIPTLLYATDRPNIVLILADDMGFSDVGCFGGEIATPHLDKLAEHGLRFTQMYNTSKCMTSRACLLTGCYAQQVGMMTPARIQHAATLGEVLRGAGYRTWWAGKHHGTENPITRGFDRYKGLRDGGCNYFNPGKQRPGEAPPAQKRANRTWCFDDQTVSPFTPREADFYTTDYFTHWAIEFLDEAANSDQPFFLYVAYNAPHDPLHAWPEDIAQYENTYEVGWEAIRTARSKKQESLGLFDTGLQVSPPDFKRWEELTPASQRDEAKRMQVYAAMVDRLDQNIGRLIAALKQQGRFDNTLILFASDNGGSAEVVEKGKGDIGNIDRWSSVKGRWANVSNTPFRKYKNHSYEGGICTPFIAHWPKGIRVPKGSIDRTPLHFIDFMATFMELGKAKYPASTVDHQAIAPNQGISFAPLFSGQSLQRNQCELRIAKYGRMRYSFCEVWQCSCHAVCATNQWAGEALRISNTSMHQLVVGNNSRHLNMAGV